MRTAVLIARSGDSYIDVTTGKALGCVGEVAEIKELRNKIRDSLGLLKVGNKEIKLDEIRILANHTRNGEFCSTLRFE
jgi:hypothetical protein